MAAEAYRNPFVGPVPFEREDADLFFGRAGEVRELVSRIVAHRVVVFYAPSGAGKTSLLNAGVLPILEDEDRFEILPPVRFSRIAAGDDAGRNDVNVYVSTAVSCWSEGVAAASLATRPVVTLASFLADRAATHDARGRRLPRAVVFDQFEEIFTAYPEHWEQHEAFFEELAAALEADRYLRVVLSLREDYVAQLDPLLPLLPSHERFRLERLERDGAVEAVTGPVARAGRSFAPGVAEALVEDLRSLRVDVGGDEPLEAPGEFVEPVQLQVVCRSLWSELPDDVEQITAEHVHTSGDVDEVLERFYDDAVRSAATAAHVREGRLRRWIEEAFITSVGTRSTVYQGQALTARLPNAAVEVLEDRHLIRAERRAGARWYELTHDRFIGPIQSANAHDRGRRARKRLQVALAAAVVAGVLFAAIAALILSSRSSSESARLLVPPNTVRLSLVSAVPALGLGVSAQSGPLSSSKGPGYTVTVQVASNGFRGKTLVLTGTTIEARTRTRAAHGVVGELLSSVLPSSNPELTSRSGWLPTPSSRTFRFRIDVSYGDRLLDTRYTKVLTGTFATVHIATTGPGSITDPTTGLVCAASTCVFKYSKGTSVTLNAIPSSGARFRLWVGPCAGTVPTCRFLMGVKPLTVGAVFVDSPAAKIVERFDPRCLTPCRRGGYTYLGYGHQVGDANIHSGTISIGGKKVRWSDRHGLTEDQVKLVLAQDFAIRLRKIRRLVNRGLSQNQWEVLTDFVYNLGVGALKTSSVLKAINAGRINEVPAKLILYVHVGNVVDRHLVERRKAEIALWNAP